MSFTSDYRAALKKLKREEESQQALHNKASGKKTSSSSGSSSSFMATYRAEKEKLLAEQEEKESTQSKMTVGKLTSKDKEEEKRTWFDKGALKDGYQFGDISKVILGTVADVGENLGSGIMGMGEKAVDALAYIAPYAYQGNLATSGSIVTPEQMKMHGEVVKESKKEMGEFIKKDLYNEEEIARKIISSTVEKVPGVDVKNSVLGEKTDSLVQSGGQLVGTIGLQALGVPWWVTSGATAFGGEAENAMNQGASYGAAGASAAISAGAEMLTEKLFGGSGLGEKGVINLDPLTRGISNKLVKTLADYGVDMAAEGAEEVVSQIASNFGSALYREENLEDILLSEQAFDEYLESFIGGAALGGFANASKFVGTAKKGTDYRSDFTQNEQKVVDKVYENRLAELEQKGKVSAKQKSELYEAISRELDKGYISIETIEEALGGEKFQNYKKAKEWEDSVQNEYDELHRMKRGDMTGEQIDRETELRRLLDHVKETSTTSQTMEQIRSEVMELAKSDRLVESYNEKARRGQAFEADLTKYDQKQQQTIQNAINSGTLNNTNRTHELVDFIAKVSADKGVLFDFTNNEKIKGTQFAVEGKIVNGYVTDSGITLNVDSPKYLESTVGHEITHVLEGTEFYDTLKTTIFEYAKSKGEYDSRMADLTRMYENIEGADIEAELAADLVGDYIFSDKDFVNKLSTENRNVFQKIYDEIKYLCKVATAGSKEARELEKVKKVFEDAYRAGGKAQGNTKYSLNDEERVFYTPRGVEVVKNPTNAEYRQMREEIYKDYPWLRGTGEAILRHTYDEAGNEYYWNASEGMHRDVEPYINKQYNTRTSQQWEWWTREDKDDYPTDYSHARYSLSEADESYFDAVVNQDWDTAERLVEEAAKNAGYTKVVYHGTDARFTQFDTDEESTAREQHAWMADYPDGTIFLAEDYDVADVYGERVVNLLLDTSEVKVFEEPDMYAHRAMDDIYGYEVYNYPVIAVKGKDMTIYATLDNTLVKSSDTVTYGDGGEIIPLSERFKHNNPDIRYSLSDTKGREVSNAVAKRFGNSKAVDENGNLKVLYHGTASGEFNIFDKSKGSVEGDYGSGFYFTDDEYDVEENYEGGGPDFDNKVGRRADEIWGEEPDIEYEEAEERARQELFKGSHKFEVYLNIENPVVVGETILFDPDSYYSQYNQEDYDSEEDYEGDVEQLIADDIDNILWDIDRNVDVYKTDGIADILWEAVSEGGIDAEGLKKKLNNLYLEDSNGNFVANEVARQIIESLGYDGIIDPTVSTKFNMELDENTTHYIVFKPNQIKAVTNQNPTDNPDIHRSLSERGATPYGNRGTLGKDVALEPAEEKSTVPEKTQLTEDNSTVSKEEMVVMFPDEPDAESELDVLRQEQTELENRMREMGEDISEEEATKISNRYMEVLGRISELESAETERVNSLGDENVPAEAEQNAPDLAPSKVISPFDSRDFFHIHERKIKAFVNENPEFAEIFKNEANIMLGDLMRTEKGQRLYNDVLYYESRGEQGWQGQKRTTSESIAELIDSYGMRYEEIQKGLEAIIQGGDAANIAAAKKIEFMIDDRLKNGYTDFTSDDFIPPNEEYLNLLNGYNASSVAQESAQYLSDSDAPISEEIAPSLKPATADTGEVYISKDKTAPEGQTTMFPEKPKAKPENGKTAQILPSEKRDRFKIFKAWDWAKEHIFDNGMIFEDLSKATGNRALEEKWDFIRKSAARAQHLIGKGDGDVKSLKAIRKEVKDSGKYKSFVDYMYHKLNVDRMTLEGRNLGPNKPVFGDRVTAEESARKAYQYETENPEFKDWAEEVYTFNKYLRNQLVEGGVINQDTADLWEKMYPHYVPIARKGKDGLDINVPLDSNKTSVNNPVKRATGGNQDIHDLFDTIGDRAFQTFRAISRNQFGVELKNTLGTSLERTYSTLDEVLETLDSEEAILEAGKYGENPTFTVFEDGGKVKFEITEEMYEALKPKSAASQYRIPVISTASELFRKLTTEYNPAFLLTNPIKDVQDILLNSQHPVETYAEIPRSLWQQVANGKYYREYLKNGGDSNSYFDNRDVTFNDNPLDRFNVVAKLNNHIEMTPRLAEYIASREAGKSVEGAMLDAARVTTNFSAGGNVAKFVNANGVPFFNASIQGAVQQVRNVREAHHRGWMGYAGLLARTAVAGLPALMLNGMWEDDEDYENLADYVKENYYIVSKTEDGRFIRIPKGRAVAVIQDAVEKVESVATGDNELDLATFLDLAADNLKLAAENLAPNNPFDNNILSPIFQVAKNKTWYDEDIVPSRLQDLPKAEQFDEKTDTMSVKIGQAMDWSPKKINYLLNQYSGGVGDMILPMMTPKAENGSDSKWSNLIAPVRDKFVTDGIQNSQVVSDFWAKQEELTVNANAKNATDRDKMMAMYLDTISYGLNDLYAQKREIQMSDKPDSEKYELTRELQQQINEAMEEALSSFDDVTIKGKYSEVGDLRFNYDSGKGTWYQIKEKNADGSDNYYYQQEQKVTKAFGIDYSDYWNNKDAYDDALYHATSYGKNLIGTVKNVFGVESFAGYASDLSGLKADYDSNGNTISGSKKEKVIDYVNNMDADYGEKIILFKSQYPKDDTYNHDIIDYLNNRDDISSDEMRTILEELGFEVDAEGYISWD